MDFRILGPFEVLRSGEPVRVPRGKQQAVLALLTAHVGRVVPAERLVDELWGGEPPPAATAVLHSYISKLRRALGGTDGPLVTRAPGYMLDVPERDVDARRFEALAAEVEHTPGAPRTWVSARLAEALELWRGPALADFAGERWAEDEAARLEEVRLQVAERRVDAELALGHHKAAIAELEPLVAANPLRERLCGQLMLALYREGRQAEALRAFSRLRTHLGDELGIVPSPELVRLEDDILQQHVTLDEVPEPEQDLPTGVVTFLLTDVEGSSALWEADTAGMADALARHDAIVAEAVARHGGTVLKAKGEGDSTFSVFVRASDAVGAAAQLQRDLGAVIWPTGIDLRVRAGVHTGEAVERNRDYFGPTVNRAARLRSVASGGHVLVSGTTAELVADHVPDGVVLDELGDIQLAGMTRPERVYALRAAGPDRAGDHALAAARPPLPPLVAGEQHTEFVGRRAELDVLRAAWGRARAGERAVVLVAGEAGVGKTSLVARLAATAHEAGTLVLAGHCDEDYGVPYQPFVEALRALVHYQPAAAAAGRIGPLGGELARLLPEVADLLPCREPRVDTDPGTARYRQFDAVATWLDQVCEVGEVMLILDDLHWAALPSLLMLRHLVRHDPSMPLLVVATYRDTELNDSDPLAELLADLRREHGIERLELSGLSEDDIGRLVRSAGQRLGGAPPDAGTILRQTGGNPFFVREVLLSLSDPRPGPVPAGIRDVVGRRLARLDPAARGALEVAAVLGGEFDPEVVAAVGMPEVTRQTTYDALDEAVHGRLAVRAADGRRYRFAHAIVRDTIYTGMPTGRRLALHAGAARALEAAGPDAHLAQISYHHGTALPVTVDAGAEGYARQAGDRALALLAYEEAADHYQRALDAHERTHAVPDADRCELLLALGTAHAAAGEVADAGHAFGCAAALARELGLADYLARAALGFEGELVTGGDVWQERRALLEQAHDALGECVSPLRVRVSAMLADVLAGLEPGPHVTELSQEALRTAVQLGDEAGLAAALHARHQALAMPSHAAERAELARRVVERSEAAGSTPWVGAWARIGRLARLADLVELGDLARFDAELDAYADAAREQRRPHDLWRAAVMRAMRALFAGRLDDGAAKAEEACALGNRLQQPGTLQTYAAQVFYVWWLQGRTEELRSATQSWAGSESALVAWHSALALAHAEAGDPDAAHAELAPLAAARFAAVPHDNMWLATLALAAEACWRTGDIELGAPLLPLLAAHAARNVTVGAAVAFGAAGRPAGLAAALAGRLDQSVSLLDAAVAANRRMGSPLWEAAAQHDLAEVLDRRDGPGDAERAEALAATASATGTALGVPRLAAPVARPHALAPRGLGA